MHPDRSRANRIGGSPKRPPASNCNHVAARPNPLTRVTAQSPGCATRLLTVTINGRHLARLGSRRPHRGDLDLRDEPARIRTIGAPDRTQ
jgi:hypothetical protein